MASEGIVHIVDDDNLLREALELLLQSAGYRTRTYASLEAFDPSEVDACIGCVLLDVRMPGANGLEYFERLADQGIDLSILMMTGHGDIPMTVRAMKAGAIDFLPKPFGEDQLLTAVATALQRDAVRFSRRSQDTELLARFKALSRREKQVMAFATAGRPNKQTAYELGLSEHTVKVRRGSAMTKMNARSLADLVRMAEALGLTPETLASGRFDAKQAHPASDPDEAVSSADEEPGQAPQVQSTAA